MKASGKQVYLNYWAYYPLFGTLLSRLEVLGLGAVAALRQRGFALDLERRYANPRRADALSRALCGAGEGSGEEGPLPHLVPIDNTFYQHFPNQFVNQFSTDNIIK